MKRFCVLITAIIALALATLAASASPQPGTGGFARPERVTIVGYTGDAMEPFITRDGRYLLFNNRNDPPDKTDLFYAERIDDRTFRFRGPLRGANSPLLDAVASVDCTGTLYFVSNRSYGTTFSTIYRARFHDGTVTDVEIAPGISQQRAGAVNFDAEISADGRTLYVVESEFDFARGPKSARIAIYRKRGDRFARDQRSDTIMAAVNTEPLQYAPSTSPDGRELYFTRPANPPSDPKPALFRSVRANADEVFSTPVRIAAAAGFVEAATLSRDGRSLYYHALRDGRFVIERLTRSAGDAGTASASACAVR